MRLVRLIGKILRTLFFPFIWLFERMLDGTPSSPPEFWMFIKELQQRGVRAQLQMQPLHIKGIKRSAIVTLDPGRHAFNVVNLFKTDSAEMANQKLSELVQNPGMSHSRQRDQYLMSVTFTEPDEQLVAKVTEAFDAFQLPPSKSIKREPHRDAASH